MEKWDWPRIAERIVGRRTELGMKHTTQLARRTLLSSRLLGDIESARRVSYSPSTIVAVERTLGWTSGSIQSIGMGGEPTLLPDFTPAPDVPFVLRAVGIGRSGLSMTTDLSDYTFMELYTRWRTSTIQAMAVEMEYADRRGLTPKRAHEELEQVSAERARHRSADPRGYVPPWETDDQHAPDADEELHALLEASRSGLIARPDLGSQDTDDPA